MSLIPGSIPVTGFIAPTDTSDTYAVTDAIYGIDGLRNVADYTERNNISIERRRAGMVVGTLNDGKYWRLKNQSWTIGSSADWELFLQVGPSGSVVSTGIKYIIESTDDIVIPPYTQYWIYGDLTVYGQLTNYGQLVIADGGLIMSGGTFSNFGSVALVTIMGVTGGSSSSNYFLSSSTVGFTQSGSTVSAQVITGSLTASHLSTGINGGATAGYILSVDNVGNFSWVTPVTSTYFVPYTGATNSLNMGSNVVRASAFLVTGTAGSGYLSLLGQSSAPAAPSVIGGNIYFNGSGNLVWNRKPSLGSDTFNRGFTGNITADRYYVLPDKAGTVALTSDLSPYLLISSASASYLTIASASSTYQPIGNYLTASYVYDNGLMNIGNTVSLGGTLSQNTIIDGSGYDILIGGVDTLLFTASTFDVSSDLILLDGGVGSVDIYGDSGITLISSIGNIDMVATASNITISGLKGLVYTDDYSSTFVTHSLVTKGYVSDRFNRSIYTYPSSVGGLTTSVFENLYTTSGFVSTSGLFKKPGDKLKVVYAGYIFAATGSTQEMNLIFDSETIAFSGSMTFSNMQAQWRLECTIMATNYTESFHTESILTVQSNINSKSSWSSMYTDNFITGGYNTDLVLRLSTKTSGTGATAGDIQGRLGYIEFMPS